jgi:hypothetical protein
MTFASRGNVEERLEELAASGGVNGEVLRCVYQGVSGRGEGREED